MRFALSRQTDGQGYPEHCLLLSFHSFGTGTGVCCAHPSRYQQKQRPDGLTHPIPGDGREEGQLLRMCQVESGAEGEMMPVFKLEDCQ